MTKEEYKQLEVSGYEMGLTLFLGKKVKEVRGYLSREFDSPVFKMTKIEFEDGTFLGCEGEHDFPYLVEWAKEGDQEHCKEYSEDRLDEVYEASKEEDD